MPWSAEDALRRPDGAHPALWERRLDVHDARATLVLVHGFAEHGGRYVHVAEALAAAGVSTLAVDLRGWGRAEGERGALRSFDEYLGDADLALRRARELAADGRPLFLLGHSQGGLVAALCATERRPELAGLVLSSPALRLALRVPAWKDLVARAASRLLPDLVLPSGLDPSLACRDPAVLHALRADPLWAPVSRARWYTELLAAQDRVGERAEELRVPLLVLAAGDDRVADVEATRAWFERAGSADRTLRVFDGLWHEVLNEPERELVLAELVAWLRARIGG